MTHAATRSLFSVFTQRRMGAPAMPRWLLVAGTVALVGVSIDLFQGPPANALPMASAQVSARAALPLDQSVMATSADERALEPGASVAAYDVSADDASAQAGAAAAQPQADDDALETGLSVAAFDR